MKFEEFNYDDISSSSPGARSFDDISSDSSKKGKPKKKGGFKNWWKKLKAWQKVSLTTMTSLLLVMCIIVGYFVVMFVRYNEDTDFTKNPKDLGVSGVIDKNIVNVALFGIDTRDLTSFKGLSDSIMILSINKETKKIKVVSVMRDSLVPIENNGKTTYGKINSAYSKGGPELAVKTLNQIFGLDISEYATVNFYGMADIIDAVGGIEATITPEEISSAGGINACTAEQCAYMGLKAKDYRIEKPGLQQLNGVQAVAYARIRKAVSVFGTNNDFGRTDRQRYVMEQLFSKATLLSKARYVSLANALIPCSQSSLSVDQILSLATGVLLKSPTFEQSRIPLEDYLMPSKSVPGAGSCVYFDLDYAKDVLHAFIYEDILPVDYMEANGIRKNNWYKGATSSPGNNNTSQGGASSDSSSSQPSSSSDTSGSDTSTSSDTSSGTSSGSSSDTSGGTGESKPNPEENPGAGVGNEGTGHQGAPVATQ